MTIAQPTGGWNCCCPDCVMHEDWFDCCMTLGYDPGNYAPLDYCEGDLGDIPCCFDQDAELITVPTQDIGPAWDVVSGEWWKHIAPDPHWTIFDWVCNDGALFAYTPGSIRCKVGWRNDGYVFMIDILDENSGLDFTVTFDDGPGSDAATTVNYSVGAYSAPNNGNEVTVTLNTGTETKSYTAYHTPLSPTNPHNHYSLTVAINGIQGLTCVSLDRAITNLPPLHSCSAAGGKKVLITVNSLPTGQDYIAFDNFYWAKQHIYAGRTDLRCPMCAKCTCSEEDGWWRYYENFRLKIYWSCLNGPLPDTEGEIGPISFTTDMADCQLTGNRFYTDPYEQDCGDSTRWFMWEINCIGNALTFKQMLWISGYPELGLEDPAGYWDEDPYGPLLSISAPTDCHDYINYTQQNLTDSTLLSCLGFSCQQTVYHIWEDDGTETEPAMP